MQKLVLHSGCTAGPVVSITASIARTDRGCRAQFNIHGDMHAIRIPVHADSERMDNLWRTTCFEIFWQPLGTTAYREFNLSPSSRWAAYDFDDFRTNSRDAPVDAIAVACAHSHDHLLLNADISAELPAPAKVALNAIVECNNGTMQYWALEFAEGKPEFHSTVCRALAIGAP